MDVTIELYDIGGEIISRIDTDSDALRSASDNVRDKMRGDNYIVQVEQLGTAAAYRLIDKASGQLLVAGCILSGIDEQADRKAATSVQQALNAALVPHGIEPSIFVTDRAPGIVVRTCPMMTTNDAALAYASFLAASMVGLLVEDIS